MLYLKELDTISSKASRPTSSNSVPDLMLAAENDDTSQIPPPQQYGHFQRNSTRKSRFGTGTIRLLQHKFSMTQNDSNNKFSTLSKIKKAGSNFKRFGSLQNLKYYQENKPGLIANQRNENKPKPPHYPVVQLNPRGEIQEQKLLDSVDLESRMNHYWHTGVTCF